MRRLMSAAMPLAVSLLVPLIALSAEVPGAASAASAAVTGTIVGGVDSALGPTATAVVILVDQQAGPTGGTVIASQRIDKARLPATFSVPYDPAAIDAAHSYALYATVADGSRTLQTDEPTPVITGGPTSGVTLTVVPPPASATATLSGTIVRNDKSALSPSALAIAALVNEASGTIRALQVVTTITAEPIPIAIRYDPGVIDPTANYVVRGGIADGPRTWTTPVPVPGITGGQPAASVTLNVSLVGATTTPSVSPMPTAPSPTPTAPTASATAAPSPTPVPSPTAPPAASPTATPSPTPTPTQTPAPSPSASPTPIFSPTPSPTASPSPTATASLSETGGASASPLSGSVEGTVTWAESHVPGPTARILVELVNASPGTSAGQVLAQQLISAPGPKPVPFKLAFAQSEVVAGATYRVVGALIDGDYAWLNETGVAVPVANSPVTGVVVPLTFRPELLKAEVSGSITGDGLNGSGSSTSYASALIVNGKTGQVIGFDATSPFGVSPVPFVVPYSLGDVVPADDYVLQATAWDGTAFWRSNLLTKVITNGNPTAGLIVGVSTVASAAPAPTPQPAPVPESSGGIGLLGFMALLIAAVAAAALLAWTIQELRKRRSSSP